MAISLEHLSDLQSQTLEAYKIIVDELGKRSVKVKSIEAFVYPDIKTVGIKGDKRVYAYPLFISIKKKKEKVWIDYDFLQTISTRITNQCKDIVRVVYRLM